MHKLIKLAAEIAIPTKDNDQRHYWLGAVGKRSDGVIVSARNGSVVISNSSIATTFPQAHAEYRCIKKMDSGGIVYVARVLRNGQLGLSKPCKDCEGSMRARGIKKVCYSINDDEYGTLYL